MAAIDKAAVGNRLKAIREASGIERKQFIAKLGLVPADWNNYEDARMLLSAHLAAKVVELVPGLTLDWIFLGRINGLEADLHRKLTEDGSGKAA